MCAGFFFSCTLTPTSRNMELVVIATWKANRRKPVKMTSEVDNSSEDIFVLNRYVYVLNCLQRYRERQPNRQDEVEKPIEQISGTRPQFFNECWYLLKTVREMAGNKNCSRCSVNYGRSNEISRSVCNLFDGTRPVKSDFNWLVLHTILANPK